MFMGRKNSMMKKVLTLVICFILTGFVFAKDRALLIGVDYYQQNGVPPTDGAVADAEGLRQLLLKKFNFASNSIVVLRNQDATTQNILRELDRVVSDSQRGDRVFISYAGHGFQVPDEYIIDEKDGLDEVIAPYNVTITGRSTGKVNLLLAKNTYITDDVFNDYKIKLVGRSVVMVFDSCHSGTISRGIGDKAKANSRYLRFEEKSRSFNDPDEFSYVPKDANGRDLYIAKDDNIGDGNLNGVVVISAASPYQEAFPIEVDGGLRGALSYLFEKAHGNSSPNITDLKTSLVREMKRLEKEGKIDPGKNGQFQVPEIEVFSQVNIWNQPLFGAPIVNADSPDASTAGYSAGLQSALTNQFSKMQVKISLPQKVFKLGDKITYTVETGEAGYLYVLVFSANQQAFCIFPATDNGTAVDVENYLPKGVHNFPRNSNYITEAQDPIGKDVFVALLSKKKLPLGEKQNYTYNEIFQRLGLEKLQQTVWEITRGVGVRKDVKLTDFDWQSAILEVETVK
jgi:hypothetical protein